MNLCQMALGIHVNQEGLAATSRKGSRKIEYCCGFADSALLVKDCETHTNAHRKE